MAWGLGVENRHSMSSSFIYRAKMFICKINSQRIKVPPPIFLSLFACDCAKNTLNSLVWATVILYGQTDCCQCTVTGPLLKWWQFNTCRIRCEVDSSWLHVFWNVTRNAIILIDVFCCSPMFVMEMCPAVLYSHTWESQKYTKLFVIHIQEKIYIKKLLYK